MKRLIINADDYGLSEKFNEGILELVERGIVTSTTVMINKKFVRPKNLLKYENISIGLHLDLPFEASAKDFENQIAKFRKMFGRLPSHIDSHKYFHLLHSNFPKVLRIAKKYKLPVRSTCSADREVMKKLGVKTPDNYISWHPARKNKLFQTIKNADLGITELLCHPGYFDPKAIAAYNKQREAELKILKSGKFKKLIRSFEPINYEQI